MYGDAFVANICQVFLDLVHAICLGYAHVEPVQGSAYWTRAGLLQRRWHGCFACNLVFICVGVWLDTVRVCHSPTVIPWLQLIHDIGQRGSECFLLVLTTPTWWAKTSIMYFDINIYRYIYTYIYNITRYHAFWADTMLTLPWCASSQHLHWPCHITWSIEPPLVTCGDTVAAGRCPGILQFGWGAYVWHGILCWNAECLGIRSQFSSALQISPPCWDL